MDCYGVRGSLLFLIVRSLNVPVRYCSGGSCSDLVGHFYSTLAPGNY